MTSAVEKVAIEQSYRFMADMLLNCAKAYAEASPEERDIIEQRIAEKSCTTCQGIFGTFLAEITAHVVEHRSAGHG
jgi:hypothetical protein